MQVRGQWTRVIKDLSMHDLALGQLPGKVQLDAGVDVKVAPLIGSGRPLPTRQRAAVKFPENGLIAKKNF